MSCNYNYDSTVPSFQLFNLKQKNTQSHKIWSWVFLVENKLRDNFSLIKERKI